MSSNSFWLDGEKFLQENDEKIAALIEKYGHCTMTPVDKDDYYMTLIKGILAQQVSSEHSHEFAEIFIKKFGNRPSASDVLNVSDEDMVSYGFAKHKVEYIKELSRAIVEGKIDIDAFDSMDDNAIIKQLTAVKGFGRWTAELFLILGLNRKDILPADDFGLKKAAQVVYNLPKFPQKRKELNALAEKWKPWRTLAVWYLWQVFADM